MSDNVGAIIKRYFIFSDMPEPLIAHNLKLTFFVHRSVMLSEFTCFRVVVWLCVSIHMQVTKLCDVNYTIMAGRD